MYIIDRNSLSHLSI